MRVTRRHKITIINIRKPAARNVNEELQCFGNSLGLFNLRDRDKSCFRIFLELLKSMKQRHALSSDELADKLNLSRGTVVHHLNKLMEAGIVVSEGRRYILRNENLEVLIDEIQEDVKKSFVELRKMAEDIDKWIGL